MKLQKVIDILMTFDHLNASTSSDSDLELENHTSLNYTGAATDSEDNNKIIPPSSKRLNFL